MPAHSHTINASSAPGRSESPAGAVPAGVEPSGTNVYGAPGSVQMHEAMVAMTGGGQSVSTRSPYLGVSFIICVNGIFPQQS